MDEEFHQVCKEGGMYRAQSVTTENNYLLSNFEKHLWTGPEY